MIEEEFVAAGRPELSFFEEHADLRRGAVVVVRKSFDDDRHLVRGVALESHVLERDLVAARARALGNGALDDVPRHAFFARLLQRRREA